MRRIFLVAAAAVAAAAAAVAADAQMLQAVVNAKAPVAVGNTITFATLANGAPVNSTAAGSGAYTGTTPTSITAIGMRRVLARPRCRRSAPAEDTGPRHLARRRRYVRGH